MDKILTADEAYELHMQMWSDMKKALGNNPTAPERVEFKENWCKSHGFKDVECNCFLCEYVAQRAKDFTGCKTLCPIDWGNTNREVWQSQCMGNNLDYCDSPISKILALSRKELTE